MTDRYDSRTTGSNASRNTRYGTSSIGKAGDVVARSVEELRMSAESSVRDVEQYARSAVRDTSVAVEKNPLTALAGAIAVGAVAAALLPATQRERKTVGPIGARVRHQFQNAVHAARDASRSEVTAAGFTVAAATNGVQGVVQAVVKALTTASTAAASSVTEPHHDTQGQSASTQRPDMPVQGV